MFLLIPLLVITAAAHPPPTPAPQYDLADAHNLFEEFLQKHGKVYNPEEYLTRLGIFKQNLQRINEHSAKYAQHEVGINRFTDLTLEERRSYLGFKGFDAESHGRAVKLEYPAAAITAPEQFDWRDHDAVTHVKDQGHCQSSWVFSAIGNIEGQYAIKHKKLIAFSEQQGIDCVWSFHKPQANCVEGWPDDLFADYQYMMWLADFFYGVVAEKDYPYTGKVEPWRDADGVKIKTCPASRKRHVTKVIDYQVLVPKDEDTLKQLLYETGPLAVGLDISQIFEYRTGIFDSYFCTNKADHSVLLVGYGVENGTEYWTLKNSWGADWGENGYFRIVRGKNLCSMGTSYTATCTVP